VVFGSYAIFYLKFFIDFLMIFFVFFGVGRKRLEAIFGV
jgi:hypothetical protein